MLHIESSGLLKRLGTYRSLCKHIERVSLKILSPDTVLERTLRGYSGLTLTQRSRNRRRRFPLFQSRLKTKPSQAEAVSCALLTVRCKPYPYPAWVLDWSVPFGRCSSYGAFWESILCAARP